MISPWQGTRPSAATLTTPAPLPISSVKCKMLKYNLLHKRGVSVFDTPLLCNQLKISTLHFTPLSPPLLRHLSPAAPLLRPAATLLRGEIIFPDGAGKTNFPTPPSLRHPYLADGELCLAALLAVSAPSLPSWGVGCTRSDFGCRTLCGFCLLWPVYAQGPRDEIRPCAQTSFPSPPCSAALFRRPVPPPFFLP